MGPSFPKGAIFGKCLLWPNGWMDQDATCPGDIVLCWDPASPSRKGAQQPPFFSACDYCGQTVVHLGYYCCALVLIFLNALVYDDFILSNIDIFIVLFIILAFFVFSCLVLTVYLPSCFRNTVGAGASFVDSVHLLHYI